VEDADQPVQDDENADLAGGDREDTADEDLLDVLTALGGAVDDQHRSGRGHRIDDADDRLLRYRCPPCPARREDERAPDREGEGVPVGRVALEGMPEEEGDGDPERRHLGEREIDEDDAAGQDVEPQVDVDPGQDQARQERDPEELDHLAGAPRAWTRRLTLRSKSAT